MQRNMKSVSLAKFEAIVKEDSAVNTDEEVDLDITVGVAPRDYE